MGPSITRCNGRCATKNSHDAKSGSYSRHAAKQVRWRPLGFPAATKSGHVEPSSLKKQHLNAIADATRILKKHTVSEEAKFEGFEFYRLRHTLSYAVGTRTWTRGR